MNILFGNAVIIISIIAFIAAVVVFVLLPFIKNTNRFSWNRRISLTIALLFASILFMHLFIYTRTGITLESVLDAFLVSLKTFLADGGITIKWHFNELDNAFIAYETADNKFADEYKMCIKAVAAISDIAAPLLTLTTVISIISQIFPKIRIRCSLFKEKFVFSEINIETVVLAESISRHFSNSFSKPMLIVTDAYVDDKNEKSSELVNRLKNIGCICIRDDILSLDVRAGAGKGLTFILSDQNKMKNLSVAIKLIRRLKESGDRILKCRNHIYVFTDLDEAEELLSKECRPLVNKVGDSKGKKFYIPYVVPIKEYKNTIYDLFDRLPLYTPIAGKDRKQLNITIFGTGKIGTEAFLAAFWCGQMLDIKLNITVLSLNATGEFKDEINRISESILQAAEADKPYCGIALVDCDIKHISPDNLLSTEISSDNPKYKIETFGSVCDRLYNTDYYIVSLGNDELNIDTAYLLRRSVERAVLEKKRNENDQVIIATSVYDNSIESVVSFTDSNVRIFPFASFDSRYSYDNVINKRFRTDAQNISNTYDTLSTSYSDDDMQAIYGKEDKEYKHYTYWSNVARRLHQKYVMFSVGVSRKEEITTYIEKLRDDKLCDRLAWLEHRRWNAFLWTMGYKRFDTARNFTEKKAHPCLVEIEPGRHHRLPFELVEQKDSEGNVEKVTREWKLSSEQMKNPPYDALDRACRDYGYICDVRRYDYPQHAEIRLTDEQMLIYLNPEANDYYSSKDNVDKYTYELYKYEKNTDGQRVWTVYRFLLDENLKSKIKSLSVDEKIAEYIIKACGPEEETQIMTWKQVRQELVNGK